MLRLRPSASNRWMNCHGSVYFDLKAGEGETSPAAERGTYLHELAEKVLNGEEVVYPDKEAEELVTDYVRYVEDLAEGYRLYTEHELVFNDHLYGTADAVIVGDNEIDIVDLKTGRGFVPVEENTQLKIYALMAVKHFGFDLEEVTVNIHVVQSIIGNVDRFEVTDLVEFEAHLSEKVDNILQSLEEDSWDFNPSEDACRFCPGRAVCRARRNSMITDFNEAIELTPEEIDEILLQSSSIKSWLADVEAHALTIVDELEHFELGEAQTMRRWKFPDEAARQLLESGLSEDDIYQRKLISPAQAEKLAEINPDLIIKPKGAPKLKKILTRT